ncbi:DUF3515 family protein [Streptomyces sp. NPDC052496]|uniref:DUF3515 family protein n=1 Tax=Streptomyces sp. NPDC052496 TaxID=3154951 RepID=UPI00341E79D3
MVPPSRKTLVIAGAVGGTALAAAGALAFAFRSPVPDIGSAPNAGHPLCGDIARHYPAQLLGKNRVEANGAGVAVWGDATVVLRCGTAPPRPTTDPCVNVNGVDWVLRGDASSDSRKLLVTYGRDPAVEVTVTDAGPSASDVLVDLGSAVKRIPQKSRCM